MSALKSPLRTVAPVPVDDVTARRLYGGVLQRRARRKSDGTRRVALRWALVGAMAGTLLTIGAEWVLAKRAAVAIVATQALTHSDGSPWGVTVAPAARPELARLSDGSQVLLQARARLEPLENTGHAVALLLAQGRATFDVHPGGPRRWTIECGLVTVEVVGTRFTVDRSPERVVVAVERGVVLVRGERVPDRVQRLVAGQELEVRAEAAPASSASETAPASSAAVHRASRRAAWRELSTKGDYAGAYQLLGADGVDAESTESRRVDDLMALADVARLSGHPAEATGPLARVVREFAKDPRASLAAFTLGKIHLANAPSAAARDFADALQLGLPSSLLEDAHANRIEALRRSGDEATARAAALEYAERFPASERARALRVWAETR